MSDSAYLTPVERSAFAHAIHGHPKRDEVFNRAIKLGTLHTDTQRVARLLDSHDAADAMMVELALAVSTLRAFFKAVGAENGLGLRALERYEQMMGAK